MKHRTYIFVDGKRFRFFTVFAAGDYVLRYGTALDSVQKLITQWGKGEAVMTLSNGEGREQWARFSSKEALRSKLDRFRKNAKAAGFTELESLLQR